MPWTGPVCDKCKRRMNVDFAVPDDVWRTGQDETANAYVVEIAK